MKNIDINMESIRSLLSHISFRKGTHLFASGTGPEGDWKIIIVSSLLITLVGIGFNAYVFVMVNKGEISLDENLSEGIDRTLDLDKLKATTRYYQEKALRLEEIRKTKIQSTDPSI